MSRRDLIRRLGILGFIGSRAGSKHEFMQRDRLKIRISNPHSGNIDPTLLSDILKEMGISREQWEQTR
ncbi:MAG: type II toxin-antitoxin system HicA family toxin [Chloroflexota bacterium]|nr:type II toxin-antitoxin system HicA family toxin [Chloroflexota bacterium]